MRWFVLSVFPIAAGACFFESVLPLDSILNCREPEDCPEPFVCLVSEERCVQPEAACITLQDGIAVAEKDGNACGPNFICVRGACQAQRCGDGVVSSGETCDGTPGCRETCTRCGDGIIDSGEDCDNGTANGLLTSGACPATCVAECGNGFVDFGEICDDGNANPRDGCAECRTQEWSSALVVSGSVQPRAGEATALSYPYGVAVDPLGRVLIADQYNHRIRRVEVDGTITTIAGTGDAGFSGDGGPATSAALYSPRGVAIDPLGSVLIADSINNRIRRVEVDGTISTIAGNGDYGFSGDGDPATSASLREPYGVAVDPLGRVLIADSYNNRIRRVEVDGTITTIAGNGDFDFSGDGRPATSAALANPFGVAVDPLGRVLIADTYNYRIRRVELNGAIHTIAGSGVIDFGGDGGPATSAALQLPFCVSVDPLGRVLIADTYNNRIRRVEVNSTITTIAGTGDYDFSGDGGPATNAALSYPQGIGVDPLGRVLIADAENGRIRRVEADGTITTVAGTGDNGFSGDGGPATSATLSYPQGASADPRGRVLIADISSSRIRQLEVDGTITTVAGTGEFDFSGDGGPATSAALNFPGSVAVDRLGRVLIADTFNSRIRRVDADGTITTIAGNGDFDFSGDGGPATSAALHQPFVVALDLLDRVLIADVANHRIRRVEADGNITTVAGTGDASFSGDGGPATSAALNSPSGIAVDAIGRVLIADTFNSRIRRVDADGNITTIAGNGDESFSGDGGPATSAALYQPYGVAVDTLGRVLIADQYNHRIRRVEVDGSIHTIAGNGGDGFSGDGGPAVSATLSFPRGVTIDPLGRVLITDTNSNRIRRVDADGFITTIAGPVHPPGSGPVTQARLYSASALIEAPDASLLAVGGFGRGQRIDRGGVVDVVVGYESSSPDAFGQARFAPLLEDARGAALDQVTLTLVITEHASGDLRIIGLDPSGDGVVDEPAAWTNASVATELIGPAGISYDAFNDSFVVVEEDNHCVRRMDRDGVVRDDPVFGVCGTAGIFPGFLNTPTHVVVSPTSGAVYVADTGNNRVLRVDGAVDGSGDGNVDGSVDGNVAALVIGDGSVSSAGEGIPARLFPVHAPRQLALDAFGNLYVASTTTVRLVANVDGDEDADGDDRVFTIFGGGARETFPESVTFCLGALTVGEDGVVYAADACQGFMVGISPEVSP